jgi:sialic acid synthase SpsE
VDFQSSLNIGLRAGAAAYKICSGDITNLNWIRQVASQVGDAPVLLDTGHASLGELEQAVDVCTDAGASVMIHHVAGGYPATLERVNLHGILALRAMFPEAAIGYSSHVEDWTIDAAAVALGAVMIEKNLTLNKTGAGPEQSAAVAPDEAMRFVDAMQDVHLALGSPRKRILVEERLSRASARRSAWLRVGLARGATVQYEHIAWRRPAVEGGFEPPEKDFLVGRTLVLDLPPGPILRSDLA